MRDLLGAAAPLLEERRMASRRALDSVQAIALAVFLLLVVACATGCATTSSSDVAPSTASSAESTTSDDGAAAAGQSGGEGASTSKETESEKAPGSSGDAETSGNAAASPSEADRQDSAQKTSSASAAPDPDALFEALDVTEDYRKDFVHGEKPAEYQRYIVLHDTEGSDGAASIIDWWDSNGNRVAAHFIVNKDGSIWQCVPIDKIAHHAGFGDTGHNVEFGTNNESRDDKKGTTPIGDDFADYGMNSYSIGIEMVHQGGEGDYPKAQLEAVDGLIAYLDAYYGFESQIIDHKAWRSGNSDTSKEFATYLKSYQTKRTHA